jgi:hypothetical protein
VSLPPTAGAGWPDSFTNWYAARFDTPKLSLPGLTPSVSPLPVVFGKSAFKAIFSTLAPGLSQSAAMAKVADAWEAGLLAATVTVAPGSFVGSPSPPTTWSVVASSVFTPASIALGKAKILELVGAANVADAANSQTPVKFREATLLLKVTTSGTNSVTPTPGPFVDANRSVG